MNPLIFIVDDDLFFRNYITSLLMPINLVNVCQYSSGESCIENLGLKPDIIILDHDMNGMSGTEVLKYLDENKIKIPVIMVSGSDNEAMISEVIQLGVIKFIRKDEMLCKNLKDYFRLNYENDLKIARA
jgi:FixJ family two-component response regulator